MKKLLLTLSFILMSSAAALACENTERTGSPETHTPGISICRTGYELLYRPEYKTAYYSAEHIEAHEVQGHIDRANDFQPDPLIPDNFEAKLSDYARSGYARGHLSPAGDFQENDQTNRESFYLSNMVPQTQKCNNSGVWSQIERVVRDWTVHYGELYVVTGPIYTGEPRFIGNGVRVPDAMYKVVWNPQLNQKLAFMVPNVELCKSKPSDFAVQIEEVEKLTNIHFFPKIQAVSTKNLWN
jgi:endonuclease G, mitochondrial